MDMKLCLITLVCLLSETWARPREKQRTYIDRTWTLHSQDDIHGYNDMKRLHSDELSPFVSSEEDMPRPILVSPEVSKVKLEVKDKMEENSSTNEGKNNDLDEKTSSGSELQPETSKEKQEVHVLSRPKRIESKKQKDNTGYNLDKYDLSESGDDYEYGEEKYDDDNNDNDDDDYFDDDDADDEWLDDEDEKWWEENKSEENINNEKVTKHQTDIDMNKTGNTIEKTSMFTEPVTQDHKKGNTKSLLISAGMTVSTIPASTEKTLTTPETTDHASTTMAPVETSPNVKESEIDLKIDQSPFVELKEETMDSILLDVYGTKYPYDIFEGSFAKYRMEHMLGDEAPKDDKFRNADNKALGKMEFGNTLETKEKNSLAENNHDKKALERMELRKASGPGEKNPSVGKNNQMDSKAISQSELSKGFTQSKDKEIDIAGVNEDKKANSRSELMNVGNVKSVDDADKKTNLKGIDKKALSRGELRLQEKQRNQIDNVDENKQKTTDKMEGFGGNQDKILQNNDRKAESRGEVNVARKSSRKEDKKALAQGEDKKEKQKKSHKDKSKSLKTKKSNSKNKVHSTKNNKKSEKNLKTKKHRNKKFHQKEKKDKNRKWGKEEKMQGDQPLFSESDQSSVPLNNNQVKSELLIFPDKNDALLDKDKSKVIDGDILIKNSGESNRITNSGDRILNIPALGQEVKSNENNTSSLSSSMPFKTTIIAQTSPNPPTTKSVNVTPTPSKQSQDRRLIDGHLVSHPYETCLDDLDCAAGRICLKAVCVCGSHDLCWGHRKPVCGRDGLLYPSHCELHRQACLLGSHIGVDRDAKCLQPASTKTPVEASQSTLQGELCEYIIQHGEEGFLLGQEIIKTIVPSLETCRDSCDERGSEGCVAFEFSVSTSQCALFNTTENMIFWPNANMNFYKQSRCRPREELEECEHEEYRVAQDPVFALCHVDLYSDLTQDQCQSACGNCSAFTHVPETGQCHVHKDKACIHMLEEKGHAYFVRKCDETTDKCETMEILPGSAPFQCSRSSSRTNGVVECHDTCVLSGCLAFKYQMESQEGPCDLYFDQSCVDMLNNHKENYYIRKCTNPEDCKYEEVRAARMPPCSITSSSTETFADCYDACSQCSGFNFDIHTGNCQLFNQESCLPDHKYNFFIKKCHKAAPHPAAVTTQHPVTQVFTSFPRPEEVHEEGSELVPAANNGDDNTDNEGHLTDIQKKVMSPQPSLELSTTKGDCLIGELMKFKADLLRFHCVRFGKEECDSTYLPNKEYIATLMFSYYDRNMDHSLTNQELWETQVINKFNKLSESCTLLDLMKQDDQNKDGAITRQEFIKAFDIPDDVSRERLEVLSTAATVGNGLEMQCGIRPSMGSQIVWERHRVDVSLVSFPDIAVFSDGTLYFDNVGLHHIGNYTCYDHDKPGAKQVHQLRVNLPPKVELSTSKLYLDANNLDFTLTCRANGIPRPALSWEVNGVDVQTSDSRYVQTNDNSTLSVYHAMSERDEGSYKCVATNVAGEQEAETTVTINPFSQTEKGDHSPEETFFLFHKLGYTAYSPQECAIERYVKGDYGNLLYVPEELEAAPSLCGLHGEPCEWGQAVNVKNQYIYVAQPTKDRVVVIDTTTKNPVQFVQTDKYPVKLEYVAHLDQVWVLCWNDDRSTGDKTVVVIREASKNMQHHMVHTQPIGFRFDQVEDIFLPPENDLGHNHHYGYVLHNEQRGLFKLDLETMRYTRAVDLGVFDCVPQHVAFVPIGGHVVVACVQKLMSETKTFQILLDYITDIPIANATLYGTPYVSPDSRHIVTLDEMTGKVWVAKVLENGMIKKHITHNLDASIADLAFHHSQSSLGYEVFMTAKDKAEFYTINLETDIVSTVKDVGQPMKTLQHAWSQSVRPIRSGDIFSSYLASAAGSSLVVTSSMDRHVHCQFNQIKDPQSLVYSSVKIH